jgi:uncharacterized DUF497 family protein
MNIHFEWDNNKNEINYLKHGLNFEDAAFIFSGETITFEDGRIDYGEKRFITIGKLFGRVVIIVHTQRSEILRIISMRKANEREKKIYYERLKKN